MFLYASPFLTFLANQQNVRTGFCKKNPRNSSHAHGRVSNPHFFPDERSPTSDLQAFVRLYERRSDF